MSRDSHFAAQGLAGPSGPRLEAAVEAARLLAEEGVRDWGFAKHKAQQRLGMSRGPAPSHREVAEALRTHLQLYAPEETQQRLRRLREAAVHWLGLLHEFAPRAAGAVVHGLATPRATLELHLFAEPAELVDIFLLDRGCRFAEDEWRVRRPDGREQIIPVCVLQHAQDIDVELGVFAQADQRWAPLCPVEGRAQRRLDLAAIKALLEAATD